MIDFHSHILPNADDGSRNIGETFNLIKEAEKAGFSSIISTSHYIENYYESNVQDRQAWISALSQKLSEENINIDLYLGNEVYFTENIMNLLKEKKITTINDTDYILFEFSINIRPINIYDVIYEMLQNKLKPILAHPERYLFVQKDPKLVYDLIDKGVLMQANYGSILGRYGEKAQIIVKKFLESDMIHFLGSDVHRQNTIYPTIHDSLEQTEEIVGKEKLYELTTLNPELVLKNKNIDIDEPKQFKISLKEKMKLNIKK